MKLEKKLQKKIKKKKKNAIVAQKKKRKMKKMKKTNQKNSLPQKKQINEELCIIDLKIGVALENLKKSKMNFLKVMVLILV